MGTFGLNVQTFLKNKKNGYNSTFSNDESDEGSGSYQANSMAAFTTSIRSSSKVHNDGDTRDRDDDLSDDALVETYKIMYLNWTEEYKVVEKKKEQIKALFQDKACLMLTISDLKEEVDYNVIGASINEQLMKVIIELDF